MDGKVDSLINLKRGEQAKIALVEETCALFNRLGELGILPESTICVERIAPLGDPISVEINSMRLALRKTDASAILVKRC